MSPGATGRKLFGGVGFTLGCGCKDLKAVAVATAVAVAVSSPSTATTATSRRERTHRSASASTGTLTVPSTSSSFQWEDAEPEADGDEVDCMREASETTPSFSGLLRQLNELEQSVKSCGRKSPHRNYFSAPKPPPPPPQLPSRPLLHGAMDGSENPNCKEGHGNFSPPRLPSLQVPTQQHRPVKSLTKVNGQEGDAHLTPLPSRPSPLPWPQPLLSVKSADKGNTGEDSKHPTDEANSGEDSKLLSTPRAPKTQKAKISDNINNGFGDDDGSGRRLDGSVAVVKQSEDPLSDFRRSMLNMIVENRIVTGDELRGLLHCFLSLNAPRHHDAILRAFAEIWDEVVVTTAVDDVPHHEPARPTAPRQRTPPRRRQPLPTWRV